MPILVAEKLRKQFGDLVAVDDVSFHIEHGEIFSLLGPNGAGKTTTISMLSCLLRPNSGDATIDNHSITQNPIGVKNAIGVVPQDLALYPSLTAKQNLTFWGRMVNLGGNALKQRIDEVLEQVQLSDRASERVDTYSGGMKRRLNIAVGLLHKPKLVFMDEPTVGIDPQSRRRILDMVQELRDQGMTVLYTTHYMEEAEELSDRVGIIDRGKMIALGTQKELTRMVGEQEIVTLHLDDAIFDGVLADVQAIDGVLGGSSTSTGSGQAENGTLTLPVRDSATTLPHIIATTNKHNLRIRSIDIKEPNLEAVFLHLTGRALRD